MLKIVLIDGLINKSELKYPDRISCTIFPTGFDVSNISQSHATTIAKVLDNLASEYVLENYVALQSDDSTNIKYLIQGLQYCIVRKPDIVIISLGSMIPADGINMYPFIQELHKKGCTIFAAQSNNGILTFPASFHEVIAIQRDYFDLMPPYSVRSESNHPLGVNITINCRWLLEEMSISYRNSFVTPVVAALYCNNLESVNKKDVTFQYSESDSGNIWSDGLLKANNTRKCRVCLCEDNPWNSFSNEVVQELNRKKNVHSIGLYMDRMSMPFPCWMRVDSKSDISSQIQFYEQYCFCELVLFSFSSKYLSKVVSQLDIDIVIRMNRIGHMVWKTDEKIDRYSLLSASRAAEHICEILS